MVGNSVREIGYIAFVAADVEDVERNLIARDYPHLTRLCTSGNNMHLNLLTQSQQRSPMPSRNDKRSFIAAHTMKLAALLESTFHSRISAASVLWEINCSCFAHSIENTIL